MSDFSELNTSSKLRVINTIKEAWRLVPGFKAAAWGGFGLSFAVALGVAILTGIIVAIISFATGSGGEYAAAGQQPQHLGMDALSQFLNICGEFFTLPVSVGVSLLAVHRLRQNNFNPTRVFDYYKWSYMWRFFLTAVLVYAIVLALGFAGALIGSLLFGVFGGHEASVVILALSAFIAGAIVFFIAIYFGFALNFSLMLIADRNMRMWQAIGCAFRAVNRNFWPIAGISVLTLLIGLVVFCPGFILYGLLHFVGIGWVGGMIGGIISIFACVFMFPWALNLWGVIYRDVFGLDHETLKS